MKTNSKENCLHLAPGNGEINLCKLLVEKYQIDVNCKDNDECCPLRWASENGSIDVFEYFSEKGGDVYSMSNRRRTCLYYAARHGRIKLCKLLVGKYEIDVNCKENDGYTPLLEASSNGKTDVVEYLVEKGGNVYSKTNKKQNCLHLASLNGEISLCKLLVEKYQINVNLEDIDGCSPLYWASLSGSIDVFNYIFQRKEEMFIGIQS